MGPASQKLKDSIVDLYQKGKTYVEIEKQLRTSSSVIKKALNQAGVASRPALRRGFSEQTKDQVASLFLQGADYQTCSDLVGIGKNSVADILHERQIRTSSQWTKEQIQQLLDLYASGKNIGQCARLMNTVRRIVRKYLRMNGVRILTQTELDASGSHNPAWKGGRCVNKYGYVSICVPRGHPNYPGSIPEHRFVMERHLGRRLEPGEVVHHKDKNPSNNQIENLQLFACNGDHLAFELKGCVPKWTEEGRKKMIEAHARWCEEQRNSHHSKNGASQSPESSDQTET